MKLAFQERDRRALIFLVCAVGLYFLVSAVVFPAYDDLVAAEALALQKEDQLLRYRRAMARSANYAELLEEARSRIAEGEARLISGDNLSLASSELQTLVEAAAERSTVELGQRNMAPARPVDAYFNEIAMSLTFQCTPEQLLQFLSDVRSLDRLVKIRSIQISPLHSTDALPEAGELTKDLSVSVTFGAVLATPSNAGGESSEEG